MKVLVAYATRHGSTAEIAERIAGDLGAAGHEVDVVVAEPDRWLDDEHDGYIVGCAVYMGNWLREGRRFLADNATVLTRRPVWLFSSGPLGEETSASIDAKHVGRLVASTNALGHTIFGGRLRQGDAGGLEGVVARAIRAPFGDFRDWDAVDAWAAGIDAALNRRDGIGRDFAGATRTRRSEPATGTGATSEPGKPLVGEWRRSAE
jgi:menaquinone-dependent protoporphyrinogen oxidase